MKPHIRRHFLGKRLGWGWGVFLIRTTSEPIHKSQTFKHACAIAAGLHDGSWPHV